jgi:hypothetical protein
MKTTKQIKTLSYNDLAFFLGISTLDAKWKIAEHFYKPKDLPLTAKGTPKIKVSDQIEVDKIDFTMHSNSDLDGGCKFTYLVNYFNNGVSMDYLRGFGESKTFIKKLKFTGKHGILNDIMNEEQYLKLQKIWLYANIYGRSRPTKEASEFINKHDWAKLYLKTKGIEFN